MTIIITVVATLLGVILLEGVTAVLLVRRWRKADESARLEVRDLIDDLTRMAEPAPRGWPDENEESHCPAVGVFGVHSEAFLTEEGPCQRCGEHPVIGRPDGCRELPGGRILGPNESIDD